MELVCTVCKYFRNVFNIQKSQLTNMNVAVLATCIDCTRLNRSVLWVTKSMLSCTINVLHAIVLKLPDVIIFYALKREICFTFLNRSEV